MGETASRKAEGPNKNELLTASAYLSISSLRRLIVVDREEVSSLR